MANYIIFGAGWLGQALAISLKEIGHRVVATCRSTSSVDSLQNKGIEAFQFQLGAMDLPPTISRLDKPIIVIAIPPSGSDSYAEDISKLADYIEENYTDYHLVYCSSTGYYPAFGHFTEDSEQTDQDASSKAVYAAEKQLKILEKDKVLILRFGGLFNTQDRHPGNWFKGKNEIPEGYANMVHQDDAVGAIIKASTEKNFGAFNIVSPVKTTKSSFYTKAFEHLNKKAPTFIVTGKEKLVESCRLETLGYEYIYPSCADAFKTKKGS